MIKVIPLKYGTIFKRIFSQPHVFQAFAEDVLGITLHISQVFTEYEYPETIGYVKTRYDLFAEDVEARVIVEIQHVKEEDFFDRFLYYHLISLAEQVKGYKAYGFDRTVYTIVVLTSVPHDKTINFSCAVSNMSPVNEYGQQVEVYPHRLVFLVPRLVNQQTPERTRGWLSLIADSLDEEIDEAQHDRPLFQEMIAAMRSSSIDPEELSEIKDEAAWDLAKARFKVEAVEEARPNILAEGIIQGKMEVARQLLDVLDDEMISLKTGLTKEQVQQLRLSIGEA